MSYYIFTIIFVFSSVLSAAYGNKANSRSQDIYQSTIISYLKLPSTERIKKLVKLGPEAYLELRKIAADVTQPEGMRARSYLALARIAGDFSRDDLMKALTSKDWAVRYAGIEGAEIALKDKSVPVALNIFQNDKSLLMRSKALATLKKFGSQKILPVLWAELYANKNFFKGKSLSIRPKIIGTIYSFKNKLETSELLKILNDKDREVAEVAVSILEEEYKSFNSTKKQQRNIGEWISFLKK